MKIKQTLINILLFLQNFIYLVKSTTSSNNNEILNNVTITDLDEDLISFDSTWQQILNYEQNVIAMEEKLKSMSEIFDELEIKMSLLLNKNMELMEKHIEKVMEQSTQAKIDKIIEEKITFIRNDMEQAVNKELEQMNKILEENKSIKRSVEDKIKDVDNIVENKSALIKKTYNLDELKCFYDRIPKTCYDFTGCENNNYNIMLPEIDNKPFAAACDFKTLDGGWTVIQRRQDGSENFFRNWTDYVEGFGNIKGEFFIGLRKLHALTTMGKPQELYIMLENFEGERRYARYGQFKVDSNNTDYKLTVGQYSGNAGDSLSSHNGQKFSTKDRNNNYNCATGYKAAWWYTSCYNSNLNGQYYRGEKIKSKGGLNWSSFGGAASSLKFTQMMIRPKKH